MNQHKKILQYLESGKSLTSAKALTELGIFAISQRLGELRRMPGAPKISEEWVDNGTARFKRWFIEPKELPFSTK